MTFFASYDRLQLAKFLIAQVVRVTVVIMCSISWWSVVSIGFADNWGHRWCNDFAFPYVACTDLCLHHTGKPVRVQLNIASGWFVYCTVYMRYKVIRSVRSV